MTITILGNITKDTLVFPDQNWRTVESLGGTLYSAHAFAAITNEPINLVCNVGKDIYEEVVRRLNQLPNLKLDGVSAHEGDNIHCYIIFLSEYGTQFDVGRDREIKFSQASKFLSSSDFILVSPMTGFDMRLPTLKKIKQESRCPIYLDYHILSLQRDRAGTRYLKKLSNWISWCTSCDFLQMNEFEAEELNGGEVRTTKEILSFGEPILRRGVRSLCVTLGGEGVLICWQTSTGRIMAKKLYAPKVERVIDTTGCGDVFAAAFIHKFKEGGKLLKSYKYAMELASMKATFSGFDTFRESLMGKISSP